MVAPSPPVGIGLTDLPNIGLVRNDVGCIGPFLKGFCKKERFLLVKPTKI